MRELTLEELKVVSGGTDPCYDPCNPCYDPCKDPCEEPPVKTKGNNGYGQEKRGIHDGENAGSNSGNPDIIASKQSTSTSGVR
jgi:hypothetical protein